MTEQDRQSNDRAAERRRIEDLHSHHVLDTDPDERFDRLTRLAQRVLDVPIALVSLVDDDRQWFLSRQGLAVEETPREVSFCSRAIEQDDTFVVRDATSDPRFADNPLVTGDPNIRFYAGAPIVSADGNKLGTLCVIDRQPRELSSDDRESLEDLAAVVEREIAAVRLATTDALTGLTNRRGFELLGTKLLRVAERTGTPAGLVFLDLDGLKAINDHHGHEAGDDAILDAAELLRAAFRSSDVIARVGGDEFCVLFTASSGVDLDSAFRRLERLIEEHNAGGRRPEPLAMSKGAADFDPRRPVSLEALMSEADADMYEDKHRVQA